MRPPAGRDPQPPTMQTKIPHHDRLVAIESLARDARALPALRKDVLTRIVTLALEQLGEDRQRAKPKAIGAAPTATIQADRRNVEVDR